MEGEEVSPGSGAYVIGIVAPFAFSAFLVLLSLLANGPGVNFLFAFSCTCMWPVAGFGLAAYSSVYESDELARGAVVSGVIGSILGLFMAIWFVMSLAQGWASFSQ